MENEGKDVIRVGSRKSELALIQTNYVIDCLKKVNPEKEFKVVTMTTLGDRILNVSLPKIGEKSLFTKDLEDALRNDTVDFVVHSLKDLPTSLPDGLAIGAVFEREDPRDALVLREEFKEHTLATLPAGSVIGTSSLRRTAQLRGSHPHLTIIDVRGNLNTRLRKLDAEDRQYSALLLATAGLQRMGWGQRISKADLSTEVRSNLDIRLRKLDAEDRQYSALLLATAGLQRMGWGQRISKILPCSEIMYAVGQGALAVECRADNTAILNILAPFSHAATYCRTLAERSFLKTLGGGCSAPVGVSTSLKPIDTEFKLSISGAVWSLDGTTKIHHSLTTTFPTITKTHKHKLSPTDKETNKKLKVDDENGQKIEHPIAHLDRMVAEKSTNLNCEELGSCSNYELFCGFTENTNIPIGVIRKSEELGRDLAKMLIDKGALEVMKVTQDLIRSSIPAKTS